MLENSTSMRMNDTRAGVLLLCYDNRYKGNETGRDCGHEAEGACVLSRYNYKASAPKELQAGQ